MLVMIQASALNMCWDVEFLPTATILAYIGFWDV